MTTTEGDTVKLAVVNTVNTALSREFDYGIHATGCADVQRAVKRYGVQVYEQEHESPEACIAASEADFAGEFGFDPAAGESSGFAYRVFPCCAKAVSA